MARTPLFAALRRSLHKALAREGRTFVEPTGALARERRRAFLKVSAASALGASLPISLAACGDDTETTPDDSSLAVAIIGGGTAGLHCAYRLKASGIVANVFEAQDRFGGRMYTATGQFPEDTTQICELGGELVDSNHATIQALCDEFGLDLDDRTADEPAGFQRDTWFIENVNVPEATIVDQFSAVAAQMASDSENADADETVYATLDETPLDEYIDTLVPKAMYPELNGILQTAYRGEYGRENNEQSALNMIYLIGSDDPDPFRIFGVSDERYHVHQGSGSIPTALAAALDASQLKAKHSLKAARDADGGGFELDFEGPDGSVTVKAKKLVFALPFTVLREVDLTGLTLSDDKRNIIDTLGYGTNAKIMMGFSSRVWREVHNQSGGMTTDLGVQQTWETTIGQDGAHGVLTNFLGGTTGANSGAGTPDDWAQGVMPDLEAIWPGMTDAYTGTAVRMHWPTVPTHKGSYACYLPGQWSFYGTEGQREGDVHFCGEHTSLDFQGYMEGAAETGAMVAAEIIDESGGTKSQGLVAALGVKTLIPQACYKGWRARGLNPFTRRRQAHAILSEAWRKLEVGDGR